MRRLRTTAPWRRFTYSGWERNRRGLRMTKEVGTLPSKTNRVDLFSGGAREAIIACTVLVSLFLFVSQKRLPRL
jgi:hypothetical protein